MSVVLCITINKFYFDFTYNSKNEIIKKEINRVYSDIDPYGEENWDD